MTDEVVDTVETTEVDDATSYDDQLLDSIEAELNESTEPVEEVPVVEPLEPPEFFSKEHKEYFKKLQELEGGRDYAEQWSNQWQEGNKAFTQKSQALAEEKRQYEQQLQEYNQYQQALHPINQIWQRQGIAPAVGVAQMAYYGQLLHTDPQALIKEVAEFANIDLNQVVEEQPYIDPHLQNELRTLKQQNQQLQQSIGQFQQGQQNQSAQAVNEQINAFASAQDDNGAPLHPYFEKVRMQMGNLVQIPGNGIDDLDTAYEFAVRYDPEIQKELQGQAQKQEAAARQAEVQKAKTAAVRTISKTKDAQKVMPSYEERLKANLGIN